MNFKNRHLAEKKAQGAIEYLLIIGAAILVVAIVVLAMTGSIGAGKTTIAGTTRDVNNSYSVLRAKLPVGVSEINFATQNANGLVVLWNFDGTSDPLGSPQQGLWKDPDDASVSPQYGAGLWGTQSINFNGSGNYLDVGEVPLGNNVTISVWVNPNITTMRNRDLAGQGDGYAGILTVDDSHGLFLKYNDGDSNFYVANGINACYGARVGTASAWHNVVVVITPSTTQIYVDGALNMNCNNNSNFGAIDYIGVSRYYWPTLLPNGNIDPSSVYPIDCSGGDYQNAKCGGENLVGNIDGLSIWSKALTSTQIQTLYTNNTV